jgi:dolichol-phosphate mannosyltransferase
MNSPARAFTDMPMKTMSENNTPPKPVVAVVIPTYKAASHIEEVIGGLPQLVDHIIVVDDHCPEKSGEIAKRLAAKDSRIVVIFHEKNLGVGGAVATGYRKSLELDCDVVVKMDSDGQMDPQHLPALINPVASGEAGYAKGNRFVDFSALRSMPTLRLMGNSALSFMVKAASGYWNIMDPTNGYTAISADALRKVNLDKVARGFFFETDMLIRLNVHNVTIKDVAIPARYGTEKSNLNIGRILARFPFLLAKGLLRRFVLKYMIYDFNMASVYTIAGVPMILWGLVFGLIKWITNAMAGIPTPTGTVMLAVLPLILGTQFIIAAINIDIQNTPKK